MMRVDSERVASIIAETAAAEIMPRFRKLDPEEIREKGPGDLVTVADTATEGVLSAALKDILPASQIVGEEGVAKNPGLLELLGGDDPVWVIDPVDGTANFAAGVPVFAVMVALVRRGETAMGWIHDPVTGKTASAISGEGSWCDGRKLRIPDFSKLPGQERRGRGNFRLARRVGSRSNLVGETFDLRCAGHEYLALLRGEAHFALYQRIHPWDHAAGALLHREAGGFAARLDGSPYGPRETTGGLLLAPDRESWRELQGALQPKSS